MTFKQNKSPRSSAAIMALSIATLALTGCGKDSSGGTGSIALPPTPTPTPTPSPAPTPTPAPAPTPTPSPAPAPTPSPAPTPTPTPPPADTPTEGLDAIPSNFDVSEWLVPAWGDGRIPESGAPDVVGAFRFICNPSHNAYDDPIVFPGQPGASHLHTFFGNTLTDAHSTYESLRTTGESTCNNMLNRSAYWIPSMMNGEGKVVMPDYLSIYYKRRPASDPECQNLGRACVGLPRGLRYVFGYDMQNPGAGSNHSFNCTGPGATPGSYKDIPEAAPNCPSGAQLGAIVHSPSCWNGRDLDSPNHRTHVSNFIRNQQGQVQCPDTHPYVIPTFTVSAWFTTDDTLDRSGNASPQLKTWHLSSDRMAGMAWHTPGSTFHSDWFGAWDDSVMAKWEANCIDLLLNCSGGDLGNGEQLKMFDGFSWTANPRLVDPPAQS